jgi:hypothetical protein
MRLGPLAPLMLLSFAVLADCGSGELPKGGDGGTGNAAGSADAGGPAGAGGAGGAGAMTAADGGGVDGAGGAPTIFACGPLGNSCHQGQIDVQNACLVRSCEAEFKRCIGDEWRNGRWSGACGPYLQCVNACPCSDTACLAACGPSGPPPACVDCLMTGPTQCQMNMCPQPACYLPSADGGVGAPTDAGGGGSECQALAGCCAQITDDNFKMSCTAAVSEGTAAKCDQLLLTYRQLAMCR